MRVEEAILTCPAVHRPSTTVGELRRFFADEHVHMALLVEGDRLLAAVEPQDLEDDHPEDTPAVVVGSLAGRTVAPDDLLSVVLESMRRSGRRRLAVTDGDGRLLGLLCLKASGRGFCSDEGAGSRRRLPSRASASA